MWTNTTYKDEDWGGLALEDEDWGGLALEDEDWGGLALEQMKKDKVGRSEQLGITYASLIIS